MITPILEKLLLAGGAKNRIHHIAYGSFAKMEIPKDSFIVIHKIYWNGWMNQKLANITNMTWKDFFRYNEYSLKVQSDKEPALYYQMRNQVDWQYIGAGGGFNVNDPIVIADYERFILMNPKKPVIFDTWITSYDFLNFTLTRNALMPVSDNFNNVNNYANEKDAPSGVNNIDVLLDILLRGTAGTETNYNPPGVKSSHPPIVAPMPQTNTISYHQDYDSNGVIIGDNGSFMNNPIGEAVTNLPKSEYVTNPLISLEYVIIPKHVEGKLSVL